MGNEGIQIAEQALIGGKDVEQLPRFYLPYNQVVDKLMHHAKLLSQLKKANSYQRKQLEQLQAGSDDGMLLALPLQRGENAYTAVISPKTRRPILILPIDPW
jgi:hypothetical protein